MATWVVRLHGRSDVWGPRDMALFGGPFIEGLITGVPDTVRDPRWLEEVLEAAGMDPDCGESYNYDLCLLDGNIMRDEVSDPRILSFAEKEKLRKLAGTEMHYDYSEILRKAQEPVFAVEPAAYKRTASRMPTSSEPATPPPPTAAPAEAPAPKATPKAPIRPKDRARWQATWRAVKGMWGKRSYPDMLQWLQGMHKELVCSEKTLSDICEAGAAGLLD